MGPDGLDILIAETFLAHSNTLALTPSDDEGCQRVQGGEDGGVFI